MKLYKYKYIFGPISILSQKRGDHLLISTSEKLPVFAGGILYFISCCSLSYIPKQQFVDEWTAVPYF